MTLISREFYDTTCKMCVFVRTLGPDLTAPLEDLLEAMELDRLSYLGQGSRGLAFRQDGLVMRMGPST